MSGNDAELVFGKLRHGTSCEEEDVRTADTGGVWWEGTEFESGVLKEQIQQITSLYKYRIFCPGSGENICLSMLPGRPADLPANGVGRQAPPTLLTYEMARDSTAPNHAPMKFLQIVSRPYIRPIIIQ